MSISPIETHFYASNTVDGQIFPGGFSMDPAIYQQQYNLTTTFGDYTQTPSIDMTQAWPTSQQQYLEPLSQSPVKPGFPPLVPRLSIAKSLVSDEGDDTSEPTSPRDEASERRKEVSWYFAGWECLRHLYGRFRRSHTISTLLKVLALQNMRSFRDSLWLRSHQGGAVFVTCLCLLACPVF